MATLIATDEQLRTVRNKLIQENPNQKIRAWQIKDELQRDYGIDIDESTIRGRFISMKESLSGQSSSAVPPPPPVTPSVTYATPTIPTFTVPQDLQKYIPDASEFIGYIERGVDKRLALHYDAGKCPLTQGKQGTGKTYSHQYYAYQRKLPFYLFSCFEDFKLGKLFGEKSIENGNVVFKEGLFVQAISNPGVWLFDEINAVTNQNTYDFHALLQNRELFVKDADNGNGKLYKLHPHFKLGFAQNPKSAKYIGGNIKPSNFLGRMTYITYPEFSKDNIKDAITKRFPQLPTADVEKFTTFYFACLEVIEQGGIPVDISIRQLFNVIDLYTQGLPLKESIEDGLTSIMEAVSQPKNKDAFWRLAQANWTELLDENKVNAESKAKGFANLIRSLKW